MADQATIRQIAERNVLVLGLKPNRGHITAATTARLADGLRCEIEEGPWKLAVDMPIKAGGEDTAPTPGMLGRGALAGCLAIGIATWSARLGIPIEGLKVEVEADLDARGELGMGDAIPPGYSEVRYAIHLESPAPPQRVQEMIEMVERHSPYLDVFSQAIPVRRVQSVNGKEV